MLRCVIRTLPVWKSAGVLQGLYSSMVVWKDYCTVFWVEICILKNEMKISHKTKIQVKEQKKQENEK